MSKHRGKNITIDEGIKMEVKTKMPLLTEQWRPMKVADDRWERRGRPSSRDLVYAEAERRLAAGAVPTTRRRFAEQLSRWLKEQHPKEPQMKPRIVERNIKDIWERSRG